MVRYYFVSGQNNPADRPARKAAAAAAAGAPAPAPTPEPAPAPEPETGPFVGRAGEEGVGEEPFVIVPPQPAGAAVPEPPPVPPPEATGTGSEAVLDPDASLRRLFRLDDDGEDPTE